jgi:hypothetical protein
MVTALGISFLHLSGCEYPISIYLGKLKLINRGKFFGLGL